MKLFGTRSSSPSPQRDRQLWLKGILRSCGPGLALMVMSVTPLAAADRPRNDFGIFDVGGRNPRVLQALDDLGVGWVRIQVRMGEAEKDASIFLRRGYGTWLTLYHRDRGNAREQGTVSFAGSIRGGFPIRDPQRYQDLVRATLRPYLEELRQAGRSPADWLIVQFENEVLPREVRPPDRPQRFWHGTGTEYLELLELGREAVRSLDPAIPVAAAGIASEMLEACVAGERDTSQWVQRLLTSGRFDWADVHLYHRVEAIPAKVAWVRRHWSGPLASTETGGPDTKSGDRYSETAHLQDLVRRIPAARDAGVQRVFWSSLVENPSEEARFKSLGLIVKQSFRRKPAFDAYRDQIAGGAP